jgi:2-succinyl-6-hydroxy-2,4-cyclohexadiene-1-carboxylate synthase
VTRVVVNGIELNVEVSGSGPDLLLLHGFTGAFSTWEPLLPRLTSFRVLRLDVIGHGASDSPKDPERYSMAHAVDDSLALLEELEVDRFGLLGYSMGGRLALHLALAAPHRLWGLVLESASPGIEAAGERAARITSDEALADSIARDGLEAFVDRWQEQPLFASQARLPRDAQERQRRSRLAQSPLGLANSLREMGAGRQEWLLPRLGELTMPALVLAGSLDEKYASLATVLAGRMPDARAEIVPDAGHAVHLEQPERFADLVVSFLDACVEQGAASLSARGGSR